MEINENHIPEYKFNLDNGFYIVKPKDKIKQYGCAGRRTACVYKVVYQSASASNLEAAIKNYKHTNIELHRKAREDAELSVKINDRQVML